MSDIKYILGFTILFLCVPPLQFSLLLALIGSTILLIEFLWYPIVAAKFRFAFARSCAKSSAFLICTHFFLSFCKTLNALIEHGIQLALPALELYRLLLILVIAITMLKGPKITTLCLKFSSFFTDFNLLETSRSSAW